MQYACVGVFVCETRGESFYSEEHEALNSEVHIIYIISSIF